MAIATLSIDLVAKLAKFEADMGKAARSTERTANQIAGALGVVKASIGGLAAGIGIGGLVAFTKSTIDSLDALNDLKDATGSTIENISALEDVAVRTGTSFQTVGDSLVKFNAALNAATPNSAAANAFKQLGLSIGELKSLDPAEALRRTAEALATFSDNGNKARLTQVLFGKSLREVAPFLTDLATEGKLVAKVTTEQAEAAEQFNKQLAAMRKNSQDLARAFISDLLPATNRVVSNLAQLTNQRLLGEVVKDAAKDLVGMGRLTDNPGQDINRLLRERAELLERIDKDRFKGKPGLQNESLLADLKQTNQLLAISRIRQTSRIDTSSEYGDAVSRRFLRDRPSLSDLGDTSPVKGTVGTGDATNELDRYAKSLELTLERTMDLSAVQTAQIRISQAGANGANEAQRTRILALAAEIDKQRELKDVTQATNDAQEERIRIGREVAIAQGVDNGPRAERLKGLLSSTDEERFARIREDVELLAEEFESGRLQGGAEQYIQAINNVVGETANVVEKTVSAVDDLGLSFASAFEDVLVGGKSVQDVLKGIGREILSISVRKNITDPFEKFLSGAVGGLFSFDGGGYTGSAPRAGGLDGKGGFLGVLHPQETVIDHTRGGRSAPVVNLYLTQNHGALVTPMELAKSNEQLVRQIQGGLMRSQNYGGALA